jgi:ribosome-binding protein aMBF1 (putative translation factor)
MSDTAKVPKIERTPEQKAEERRIREMHRQNPVREVPADTVRGADVAQLFRLAAAIRREREAQGLSIEQLAERAGVDVNALSRLEAGQGLNPTVSTLFRLAHALGRNLVLSLEGAAPAPN